MDMLFSPAWMGVAGLRPAARERPVSCFAEFMEAPDPVLSDLEVFERFAAGDASAFAEFYDRHATLLFSVALRIVGNVHDAEDVLQEAAVLLWERSPLYNPAFGKPVSWAVALTRNKAIDRLRSTRRKAELHDTAAHESVFGLEGEPAAPEVSMSRENSGSVHAALATLPVDQQKAIELAFFRGLTQTEIATQLCIPLGTVKARIRRGMLTLRDALEDRL